MPKNDSLKTLARTRMETTGENYTTALEDAKMRFRPNVDMMTRNGVSVNGSMDGAVLVSYGPLMDALHPDWTLMNTGPGWNQLLLTGKDRPLDGIEDVSFYAGAIALDEEDTDDDYQSADLDYLSDVWDTNSTTKLSDCDWFYAGEAGTINNGFKSLFPLGDPPAGEWIKGLERGFGNAVAIKIVNDGPDFIKNIATLMNWIAENAQKGTSA